MTPFVVMQVAGFGARNHRLSREGLIRACSM
jgi:hypothetical protein